MSAKSCFCSNTFTRFVAAPCFAIMTKTMILIESEESIDFLSGTYACIPANAAEVAVTFFAKVL